MKLVKKFLRFIQYYGVTRVLFKAYGRSESSILLPILRIFLISQKILHWKKNKFKVAIVGCGQYGFSTIGYFLSSQGHSISCVYDTNEKQCNKFIKLFGARIADINDMLHCDLFYIASSHSSHASYAVKLLGEGKWVHIEKPLAVDLESLMSLTQFYSSFKGSVGFNRPHSSYTAKVLKWLKKGAPISISFIITGHDLSQDHWYNDEAEGTRLSGNFSHWVDLTIFYLNHIEDTSNWFVSVTLLDDHIIDDNILVDIRTEMKSRCTILFQTRKEPILGIQESHYYQQNGESVYLDDYRRIELVTETNSEFTSSKKDVGHKGMLEQKDENLMHFQRALESTSITLKIIDAVRTGSKEFSITRNEPNHTKPE